MSAIKKAIHKVIGKNKESSGVYRMTSNGRSVQLSPKTVAKTEKAYLKRAKELGYDK